MANSSTPVVAAAPANANVTAISAGAFHTLAVISGAVFACGVNRFGQLGDGTIINRAAPTAAAAPANANIVAVSAGWDHSLALSTTGTVYAWGQNRWGQLGNGNAPTASAVPVAVTFPVGTPAMTAIAAGGYFSLSLDSTGAVWAWGNSFMGQLGQPAAGPGVSTPTQTAAPANTGVTAISAGACHSLAVKGGTVLAWGYNGFGQLANVAGGGVPGAVTLPGGVSATTVAAGGNHSLALTTGGAVLSWGRNNVGQLGIGNNADTATPTPALAPANANVSAIAAGWQHNLALTSTGGSSPGAGTLAANSATALPSIRMPRWRWQLLSTLGSASLQRATPRAWPWSELAKPA